MAGERQRISDLLDSAKASIDSIRAEVANAFPDQRLPTDPPITPTQTVVNVKLGDSVQKAFDSLLASGGVIKLAPGDHKFDMLKLPERPATSNLITFTSDSANLPTDGKRITPQYRPALAVLNGISGSVAPVKIQNKARNVAFVNVGFGPPVTKSYTTIDMGGDKRAMPTAADRPENFLFDRVYVFGDPTLGAHRGIAPNAKGVVVRGSYFENIFEPGRDSQAIGAWNGAENILLENNFFEAGAENVMFGGSDSAAPEMIPRNVIMRGCTLSKNPAWAQLANQPSMKCLFEIKNIIGLKIDGCLFEQNWARDWPDGVAIALKSCNGENIETWATCENVEFANSVIRNVGAGFVLVGRNDSGRVSQWMKNVVIRNVLLHDINTGQWTGTGKAISHANPADLTVDHVTFQLNRHSWMSTWFDSGFTQAPGKLTYTNNVVVEGAYGYISALHGIGYASAAQDWSGAQIEGNVFKTGSRSQGTIPPNNLRLVSADFDASFGSQHEILPSSQAAAVKTTDGTLPGADIPALVQRFGNQL